MSGNRNAKRSAAKREVIFRIVVSKRLGADIDCKSSDSSGQSAQSKDG